ncbi:MAG: AbrB/MazE/SpoVT family DNA-binding domain-containing protein [Burkholderiaceae bacterium]
MHTTLTSKGQMTLPAAVRSQLGLEAGDQLSVTVLDAETIVLKRRASRSVATLRGLLPRPAKALTLQQMDDGVAAHLARKHSVGRQGR